MFLAWSEIKFAKLRYSMVISLIFLIAYLVFFLTGLAYGLAQSNRTAIDKWQADQILLAKDVNGRLGQSMIESEIFNQVDVKGDKAILYQRAEIVTLREKSEKINVNFFGIDWESFLGPNIIEGREIESSDEVVVDISIKEKYQANIGDTLTVRGKDNVLKIVGFTENAQLSVSPVVYMDVKTYTDLVKMPIRPDATLPFNGIVIRGDQANYDDKELDSYSIDSFINELPGYGAQNLTFGFMIIFLIIIGAIVIGIFMYILTMQKQAIFGVMKAEGISSWFIAKSVIWQTFILSMIGVGLGTLLTYLTGVFLPKAVPFELNLWFVLATGVLMVVIALVGSIFSVRSIVKIDPLDAIG